MIFFPFDNVLRRNYQVISTNRFVVDSSRFWRLEFHPRFNDIFSIETFQEVFDSVNAVMSYPISTPLATLISQNIFYWFSGFRFSNIPTKDPLSPQQFLAELSLAYLDILPVLQWTKINITDDDFNVVTLQVDQGKTDVTKVDVNENTKSNSGFETQAEILSETENLSEDTMSFENIDQEDKTNTKTISDAFHSPQDQGVTPITSNQAGTGVDGITIPNSSKFTTLTNNENVGDTTQSKQNTSQAGKTGRDSITQNNDIRSIQNSNNETNAAQNLEITNNKNDELHDRQHWNKAEKLKEFYELNQMEYLILELQNRLSRWILAYDIATGERNYLDFPRYE